MELQQLSVRSFLVVAHSVRGVQGGSEMIRKRNWFIAAAIGLMLATTGCGSPTPSCGDGTVDPDEGCDPPDGVFCDAQCQAIGPCAVAGVCDDGNECTADSCTADPSDNTAICENPELTDGTACNGPGGECAAGQCVVPNAPVLTGIETALITLNECGLPGSTFEYKVDYTDPDGDVTSDGTRVFVYGLFSNGPAFSYESPGPFNIVSGNGFTGSVSAFNCLQFGPAIWVDITITIHDAIGHVSNSLTVRLPKPAGAE